MELPLGALHNRRPGHLSPCSGIFLGAHLGLTGSGAGQLWSQGGLASNPTSTHSQRRGPHQLLTLLAHQFLPCEAAPRTESEVMQSLEAQTMRAGCFGPGGQPARGAFQCASKDLRQAQPSNCFFHQKTLHLASVGSEVTFFCHHLKGSQWILFPQKPSPTPVSAACPVPTAVRGRRHMLGGTGLSELV